MRIAIIGAGLAGLSAAVELHRTLPEAHVDVFEASDRIGGKLFSVPFESGPVDVGAEGFGARNVQLRAFFASLGLEDSIVYPSGVRTLLYCGGKARPLPAGGYMGIPASGEAVRDLVSAESADRIDAESAAAPILWTVGQDVSAGELIAERYGRDVVDRCVSPLLGGVHSCSAYDVGLRATARPVAEAMDALAEAGEPVTLTGALARIAEERRVKADAARDGVGAGAEARDSAKGRAGVATEAPDGADARTEAKPVPPLGGLRGGYTQLIDALADECGADIYIDSFISGIERVGAGWKVTGGGEPAQEAYDRVIVATPAPTAALLLKKVAPEASATISEVKLADSVVVAFKFDSGEGLPDNSGLLVANDEPEVHVKAFTFSSKKWPHLAERGGAIIRASFGRYGDPIVRTDEDTLVDWALDDLKTMTGFDGRAAGASEIFTQRWFGGIPRYEAGHLERTAKVREQIAAVDGLEVIGAWTGSGVGVPAVIAGAREAARRSAQR